MRRHLGGLARPGSTRLADRRGMTGKATARTGQAGLGLLEIMFAVLIAGIALVAFRSASEAITTAATAARYQETLSRTRSRLDLLGTALSEGEQSGADGRGYRWR